MKKSLLAILLIAVPVTADGAEDAPADSISRWWESAYEFHGAGDYARAAFVLVEAP